MAWNGYYGEPLYYVSYPDARQYEELAPVTFREPPFYDDGFYRRDFRHHHPDLDHNGLLIPRDRVLLRRENPATVPWWFNGDCPHNGYHGYPVVLVPEQQCPAADSVTTVELYVPQLCCDSCEHRVLESLNDMAGVENVTADQWSKKVVVGGRNLRPDDVLRRLQRNLHMNRSAFWGDRRS